MARIDDFLDGKTGPAKASSIDAFLGEPEKPTGFIPTIKRTGGQMLTSAARTIEDVTGANAVTAGLRSTGQGIIDRNPSAINSIADVVDKPWQTVKEAVGQVVPQLGAAYAGAKAGALAGGKIAGPRGAAVGGAVGGLAPIFTQEYGGIRDEQIEGGQESIPRALGAATVATGLERLGIDRIAFKGLKSAAGQGIKGIAKQAGKDALTEGVTEAVQTGIEQYGAFKDPTTRESLSEAALAGTMGAIGGGVVGGAARAVETMLPGQQSQVPPPVAPPDPAVVPPPAAAAPVAPPVPPVAPPAPPAADAIRSTKFPETGPLSGAVNASIEAEAQAVEAVAPPAAPLMGALKPDLLPPGMREDMAMQGMADQARADAMMLRRGQPADPTVPYVPPATSITEAQALERMQVPELAPAPDILGALDEINARDEQTRKLYGQLDGTPFKTKLAAAKARREDPQMAQAKVVPVAGGFALQQGAPDAAGAAGNGVQGPVVTGRGDGNQLVPVGLGQPAAPAGAQGVARDGAAGVRPGVGAVRDDALTSLKAQWSAAVAAGDTAGAAALNERIVAAKKGGVPAVAPAKDVMPAGLSVTFGGKTYPVESVDDAQAKWITFRDSADGGGMAGASQIGNGVRVVDGAGRFVARISYNGRVWDTEDDFKGGGRVVKEAPDAAPVAPVVPMAERVAPASLPQPNAAAPVSTPAPAQAGAPVAAAPALPPTADDIARAPTMTREQYDAASKETPSAFAIGLAGDNMPMSFTQRKMATDRIPARLKDRFDIVASGTGANRRYWVIPTHAEYLRRRGDAPQDAPAPPKRTLKDAQAERKAAKAAPKGPATAQQAIDAFNADDTDAASAIMAKLRIDALKEVGQSIGFSPYIKENAAQFRERIAPVIPRLGKTAREKAMRQKVLYDKLMGRAMDYDRAADHMENSLRLGNAIDSDANTTAYQPMSGGELKWMPIPKALDRLAVDVDSLRSDPEYAEVAPMVQAKRPRVFDHKPQQSPEPFEHAGLKVYPTKISVAGELVDRWAVQLPENKATGKVGGDTLHATVDEAKKSAEYEAKRAADRAEFERKEAEAKSERDAKVEANRGKTIKERFAGAVLDKPTKLPPAAGLGTGTRREAMQMAVEQGRAVVEVQVEDTAAKNADKRAVEAVSKAGYLLGLSNENIPVVKAGLAARDRLKANKYEKPEYRVYGGRLAEGPFYEITKVEFDYAQSLKAQQSPEPPAPTPEAESQAPAREADGDARVAPGREGAGPATAGRKAEWRPTAADVLNAVHGASVYGKPYTNSEGMRQKSRILKALQGLGLKPAEAQSVLDRALTTEAQRRLDRMRFLPAGDVRDAAEALGYVRPIDAPAKRDEYPLGKTTQEDRFFGTRVRVRPELKGDTAWEGTIQMTLNGGRLFSVKRDGSDAGSIRISGDRLEILSIADAEAKPKEPAKAPASINMLPFPARWDALVEHVKNDGGDPDKAQRSYRALTQLIGGIEEKPLDVWDRWSSFINSGGLVDMTGPQVLKWMESNLPLMLDGYIRALPGSTMSSTNAGDSGYWQRNLDEIERRSKDHNRYVNKLERQARDVAELGGDAEKVAAAYKTIEGVKRAFNSVERTAQQGLASAEAREKEQAEQSAAAEAAKYKPFDAKELGKKPTPASMTGWFSATYEGKTVWTQGTILDLSGDPPHLAGYEDRMSPDRNKGGKLDVSRVIPRKTGPRATPFGFYDGEFGKTAKNGIVYFEAEGRLIGANATLFRYFASKFKGADYFASPDGDVITVKQGAKTVGVLMPIKLGSDAVPAPSLAEVKAKIKAGEMSAGNVARDIDAAPPPPQQEAPSAEPAHFAQIRNQTRAYWDGTAIPAIRDYLRAFDAFGADRMERNKIKPAGMTAREWLESFVSRQSTWDQGRKTGQTGIQYLSIKDLWPTDDGAGERLRKSALEAVKALKNAPSTTSELMAEAFMERKPEPVQEAPSAPESKLEAPAASLDLKGFERTPRGNGAFDLNDGNMRVRVEPTERGKFQASFGSAKSSPHLQGEQGAVDWAAQYRKDATPAEAPKTLRERVDARRKPVEPDAPGKIDDAGEKIGGARKDKWKERGLAVEDLDAMSEAEGATLATKANVWKPDYEAIAAQSEPVTAAMVKVVYDQLAAQPKTDTPQGRRDFVTAMQAVRKVYSAVKSPEEAKTAYEKIRAELGVTKPVGLTGFNSTANADARRILFSVYKGRSDPFVLAYNELARAKKLVNEGFPSKAEPWTRRFEVSRVGGPGVTEAGISRVVEQAEKFGVTLTPDQIRAGVFAVIGKVNRKFSAMAATKEDAEIAAKAIYAQATAKDKVTEPERPHLDKLAREGLPQAIDRDVTADDFLKTFGFKGVEFGNWSAQDERQKLLNLAFDALSDLATIMNVPRKALSLNGTMSMAFGARGGGRFAAHYEPGKLVINMTKINGGGSLAHEWAHAFDHYLGELDRSDAYQSKARGASGWYGRDEYSGVPRKRMEKNAAGEWVNVKKMRLENLRPELGAAIDGVMRALYGTPKTGQTKYAKEAQALSGKSSDGYWLRPTEMWARAFESYVFDRLAAMGAKSEYLVHGVEQDRFASGYKGNPYPAGDERIAINKAFDEFVAEVKSKDADNGNVALFSRSTTPARQPIARRDTDAVIANIRKAFPRAPDIVVHDTMDTAPQALQDDIAAVNGESDVEAAYHGGKIHVFPANIDSLDRLEFVVGRHEIRHAGMDGILGKRKDAFLADLYAKNPNLQESANLKLDRGLANSRVEAVEEALADMPVDAVESLTGFDRLVAAIRVALRMMAGKLRGMGLRTLGDAIDPKGWTDKDLAAFVRKAENVSRASVPGTDVAFARAWHGTPHRFDKFTTDAIGTGEGAQAFGHGLYFASKKEIADYYRESLTPRGPATLETAMRVPMDQADALYAASRVVTGDLKSAVSPLTLLKARSVSLRKMPDNDLLGLLDRAVETIQSAKGQLYEVEIPDDADMLLWDKPLSEQSEKVRMVFNDLLDLSVHNIPASVRYMAFDGNEKIDPKATGERIYRAMGDREPGGERAVSDFLLTRGIRGIKYLDGTSRADGDGTYNYVVFSGDDVAIKGTMFSRAPKTDSEAFRRWFGDSKVTTQRGDPLVVYHGAPDVRFAKDDGIFKTLNERYGYRGSKDDPARAFFFTDSRRAAETYADDRRAFDYQNADAGVVDAYLSIKNPLVIEANGRHWRDAQKSSKGDVIAEAKAAGHDGLIIRNVYDDYNRTKDSRPVDVFVAFASNQIKSATGNRGTFDPANPDTRFSRAAADALRSNETVQKLSERAVDMLRSDSTVGILSRTIGTPYHLAHVKGDGGTLKNPDFAEVYHELQGYLNDINTFANDPSTLAPDVVPQLNSWRDIMPTWLGGTGRPLRMSDADRTQVADAVYQGTLIYTRDENGDPVEAGDDVTPGIVWTADELRSRYGFTDGQIARYEQARASIDRSLDIAIAADVARYVGERDLPRAMRDMVSKGDTGRFRGLLTAMLMKQKADAADAVDMLRAEQKAEMAAFNKRQKQTLEGPQGRAGTRLATMETLDAELAGIKQMHEAAMRKTSGEAGRWASLEKAVTDKYARIDDLKARGYAPLMRFGSHTLTVRDRTTSEVVFFGMYETQAEANVEARRFRADPEFAGASVVRGELSKEEYKLFRGVSPEALELFGDVAGIERTPMMDEYIRRTKANHSAMKRLIKRKGTAGYSEDVQRTLAAFLTSNARMAASNLHAGETQRMAQAIAPERGMVKDYAVKLADYVQNPIEEAQGIRGLMFVQYIGGSIASALTNLTQPWTMTIPFLSQHTNPAQAATIMATAMKDAVGKMDEKSDLGKAVARAVKDGIISPQSMHELQGQAFNRVGGVESYLRAAGVSTKATGKIDSAMRKTLFAWGGFFSLAEQFNRRSSFIAAYRLAQEKNMADPFAFAEDAVSATQGVYNRGNRPQWARGAIGATVMTFKQFSISYIEFFIRLPKREKALALAALVVAAGLDGLPFADDLDDLIDTIAQMLGYSFGAKQWRTKVLADAFGRDAAEWILHGATAVPGFPIDMAGRMSLGNLIPGTGLLLNNGRDKSSEVLEALGPAGGVVRDALRGEVAPVAIRNAAKGAEMYRTGEYRDTGGRKVADADALDAMMKSIGFQPQAIARESRDIRATKAIIDQVRAVESEIVRKWAQGIADSEPETVQKAIEALQGWNERNPETPIRINRMQIARTVRDMKATREQRYLKTVPKELQPVVRAEIAG